MRKSHRQITDQAALMDILQKCDSLTLAMHDGDFPYVLPMSFGMQNQQGHLSLYFHCAKEGKKLELLKENNRVAFTASCGHQLILNTQGGHCTTEYESVAGTGLAVFLEGEEKLEALHILMRHYIATDFAFNHKAVPITTVFRVDVLTLTGKSKKSVPQSTT